MEREANSWLLSQIWNALDGIRPPGERESLAEQGFVTAASTDGDTVRVLLRLPANLVRRGEFLRRVEHAMRAVPTLDGIALRVKPYWPVLSGYAADWTRPHGECVTSALVKLRENGWTLDAGVDRPGVVTPEHAQPETLRVIISARIPESRAPASPVAVPAVH